MWTEASRYERCSDNATVDVLILANCCCLEESMIRATLYMKVKAGREDEFEQAWRVVGARTRLVPGNIRQALLRDPEDSTSFVITSDWESREAFGHFEHSTEQDMLTAPLRELRESAKMTIHELVVHIEKGMDE
jgi:heme-degrading monooxygenase HmoA